MLTDNYIPEMNANARIFSELAELWAERVESISVITSQPNFPQGKIFPGYKNKWFTKESIRKVNVLRVKTFMHPNQGLLRRTLDFISFAFSSIICGLFQPKPDIIMAVSPQFFCAVSGCLLAILKKTPFVFVLCDLWPDSVVANGIIGKNNLYKLIKKIEIWMYQKSSSIIILSENFKTYLIAMGIDEKKIIVSIAGANKSFYPREKNHLIMEYYQFHNKFIVGYIGTLGASQNLETLLCVAQSFETAVEHHIQFFMVGDGVKKKDFASYAANLKNLKVEGPFAIDLIPEYWSVVDVALVPLAPTETNSTVLPSKMLEAMSMGIPVILFAPTGEAQRFLQMSQTGWFIDVLDIKGLEHLIRHLAENPAIVSMHKNKAANFAKKFSREKQAEKILEHLEWTYNEIAYEKI